MREDHWPVDRTVRKSIEVSNVSIRFYLCYSDLTLKSMTIVVKVKNSSHIAVPESCYAKLSPMYLCARD